MKNHLVSIGAFDVIMVEISGDHLWMVKLKIFI